MCNSFNHILAGEAGDILLAHSGSCPHTKIKVPTVSLWANDTPPVSRVKVSHIRFTYVLKRTDSALIPDYNYQLSISYFLTLFPENI